MAEIYSKIGTLRNNVYANQKAIITTLQTVALNGQCTAGVRLSNNSGTFLKAMASADTALCSAYASAASMVKASSKISAAKYAVKTSLKKNAVIKLNYTVLEQCRNQLVKESAAINTQIKSCTSLISELNKAKMKTPAQQTVAKVTNVAGGLAGMATSAAIAAANKKAMENNMAAQAAFNTQKSVAIAQLQSAKKQLSCLDVAVKQAMNELATTVAAFKAADSTVSKKIADFNKTKALQKASAYNKAATTSNYSEIKGTIAQLEAAQKDYIAAYGQPSEEIAGEIARLKKLLPGAALASVLSKAIRPASEGGEVGKTFNDYKKDGISGQWCDWFVLYILRKAGLNETADKLGRTCADQIKKIKSENIGTWISKSNLSSYTPKTGDLVYFGATEASAGHVGILYVDSKGKTYVLHGNFGNPRQVCYGLWDNPYVKGVSVGGYSVEGNLKTATIGICSLS